MTQLQRKAKSQISDLRAEIKGIQDYDKLQLQKECPTSTTRSAIQLIVGAVSILEAMTTQIAEIGLVSPLVHDHN